jgi:hypothetical protein
MKDAILLSESLGHDSDAAQPIAVAAPSESTLHNAVACSPRANLAFAALDAVRNATSLLRTLLCAWKKRQP